MVIVLTKIVLKTASNMPPSVIFVKNDVRLLDKWDYCRMQSGVGLYVALSSQTALVDDQSFPAAADHTVIIIT